MGRPRRCGPPAFGSYLQKFPVDVLKIDKAFVDHVARGGSDAALARTIVALGDMLALRTVAEGVGDAEQRERLRAMGCALGQGYLFARPLTDDALRVLLAPPTPGSAGAEPAPPTTSSHVAAARVAELTTGGPAGLPQRI